MFRIDDPSASATLPTPESAGTEGYFTEGNPASGVPATLERASWFNMVQEELRNVVIAGGQTPSKTSYNQVLTAIRAMMAPGKSFASNGYCVFPNGLILQWLQFTQADSGAAVAFTANFPISFPSGCLQALITGANFNVAGGISMTVESMTATYASGFTNAPANTRTYRLLAIGY